MPITQTALTQEEIDFLAVAALAPHVANRDDVTALDRITSPSYAYLLKKAKKAGNPVLGGFRFMVKGTRGQKITWWDGADILPFQTKQTVSKMDYFVGKGHLGDELLYDLIERNGIRVDYNKGIREGAHDADVIEKVVNIIKENSEDIRYNWIQELRKNVWLDNANLPKCFTGVDGLFPVTSNSTGVIGGRSRSASIFRHQLITGVTVDTVANSFFSMIRRANRRANGSQVDWIACGDTFYDLLVSLFLGTSTVAGKFDYRAAREWAQKNGEKYGISLPQDCFMYGDIMIVNEPVFEEIDAENSFATPFGKRCYFLNTDHFGVMPVMEDVVVPHGMPYNQRLQRTSYHGELTEWCDLPNSCGVMAMP
jgi:hypothetical protein